ncbi:uncharacterized protein ACBT44_021787 isoform 2-T2 [Syngnathus typhle]
MSAPLRTRWTNCCSSLQVNTDLSRSAALCFVEMLLSERTPHQAVELAGFRLTRADCTAELSVKSMEGGLCFYINERLGTQMLADQVTDIEKPLPNSLIIVLDDLNRANLAHELPRYRQHVTCPTRGAQTLEHCYTMIKDAYHSVARAALGLSDNCLVHLIPAYRQKLKTSKPVVRTVRKWTVESRQDLQACFDCIDWGVFEAATSDLHELTDTVTSYVSFCEDLFVQTKTFCTYNNDKPWLTLNLRRLRKVEEAYRSGDRDLFKQTRNTLNREVRKARRCYGESLKRHLSANPDPSTVWKGLQSITGYKKRTPRPVESPRLANQLNRSRARTPDPRGGSAPDVPETKDQEGTGPRQRITFLLESLR